MTDDNSILLSPRDVQSLLKISHATFWRLVKDRVFTIHKIRRASRILRAEVDEYVRNLPKK